MLMTRKCTSVSATVSGMACDEAIDAWKLAQDECWQDSADIAWD